MSFYHFGLSLTLLHSERTKLYTILVILNAVGLNVHRVLNTMDQDKAPRLKNFFMLNSINHEISDAYKYKNIKKFSFFMLR